MARVAMYSYMYVGSLMHLTGSYLRFEQVCRSVTADTRAEWLSLSICGQANTAVCGHRTDGL